jgi:hypothetical protein
MRRAGFSDVRTVFHINAEIPVPRALRRFAGRTLVIGRRESEIYNFHRLTAVGSKRILEAVIAVVSC